MLSYIHVVTLTWLLRIRIFCRLSQNHPSTPFPSLVWRFTLTPFEAIWNFEVLFPATCWAPEYNREPIIIVLLWRQGFKAVTTRTLIWSSIAHWACTWVCPSVGFNSHRLEHYDVSVGPKCLMFTNDMNKVDAVENKLIEGQVHDKFVGHWWLEVVLWET